LELLSADLLLSDSGTELNSEVGSDVVLMACSSRSAYRSA
jgi:hypothetical protein